MLNNLSPSSDKVDEMDIQEQLRERPYYIDRLAKTPERCLIAVSADGFTLRFIPKVLHTSDLCMAAVKQNGRAIKYVSKKILSNNICLEAIKNNGFALGYIPENLRTKELYTEAVKQNGATLICVPDEHKTQSLCMEAVMKCGLSLEHVPSIFLSDDFYVSAITQNGLALKFVPYKSRSKKLCILAMANNSLALEYVPKRLLTQDLCRAAMSVNWESFLYASKNMYTLENCCVILTQAAHSLETNSETLHDTRRYINEIIKRFPSSINKDFQIINLERKLRLRYFTEKMFNKSINKFTTREFICYQDEDEIKEFVSFFEFYEYLQGDLDGSNLSDFDFIGIDLKDFNIDGAYISSAVLKQQNLYDDSFYVKNIGSYRTNVELMFSELNEVIDAAAVLHDLDVEANPALNENTCKMYYISDIHLNHKLLKAFPAHATKQHSCNK